MLQRLLKGLQRCADGVAAMLLAVIFVAFILQIVLRYVFNWPVGWTTEVSLIAWLWLILWGTSFVLKDDEEIRIDLAQELLGGWARRLARALGSLAMVALLAMSLPAAYDYVSFMRVEKTSYLGIRLDVLYSIYLVFSVAVIVRHLGQLWMLLPMNAARRSHTSQIP